jgi:sugar lactone lactonase YvrE
MMKSFPRSFFIMPVMICLFLSFLFPACAEEPDRLVTVFQDTDHQFTGIALSPSGRLFLVYPNWLEEHTNSLVEVMPDGKTKPYPDEKWNSWKKGEPGKDKFVCAQAAYIDNQENLWIVDPASPQMEGVLEGAAKLVRINLKDNRVERVYMLDSQLAGSESYINDVAVDTKHQVAYLTDSGTGALVLLDLKSGKGRRFFEKHQTTVSDSSYVFKVNGKELVNAKGPVKIHSDGIALTPDGRYLYYKPLTDIKLSRIETKWFFDRKLKADKIGDKIERLGTVCTTDGMAVDRKGNVYLGDITHKEIVRYGADGKTEIVFKDDRLLWPDSYAISKDGWLYMTCSQIHLMPWFNEGKNLRTAPYTVYKLKLEEDPGPAPSRRKK